MLLLGWYETPGTEAGTGVTVFVDEACRFGLTPPIMGGMIVLMGSS